MQKYLYCFLAGVILSGIGWYFIGRNDLGEIRSDYDRVNGDFQNVQRNVNQLTTNADGFAGDIASLTDTSTRIGERGAGLSERLTAIDGTVITVIAEVDKLEDWNRQGVRLGKDFGLVVAELRRLNREGTVQE